MGLAKENAMECEERGYGHSEKRVCHECMGDESLKKYIKENGSLAQCDYCGRKRKCVTIEDLMPAIMGGIYYLYDKADNWMPCDQGVYQGDTFDTYDLIFEKMCDELNVDNEEILDDIVNIMSDECWCVTDPYEDKERDIEYYNWTEFCKMVKEKVRFVFYRTETSEDSPSQILDIIARYADEMRLERQINNGYNLYRSRTHPDEEWCKKRTDFSPPPIEKASAGRMNAAGI